MNSIESQLIEAKTFGEIFSLVRQCVYEVLGKRRAGIMLGLSPLGISGSGFIGAYHQLGSNLIVLNETLLKTIQLEKPKFLNYHVFHLLMHEYLHSLGIINESMARLVTYNITKEIFGKQHIITDISARFEKYLPNIRYSPYNFMPQGDPELKLIDDFEEEDTSYIA